MEGDLIVFFSHSIGADNPGHAGDRRWMSREVQLKVDTGIIFWFSGKDRQNPPATEVDTLSDQFPGTIFDFLGSRAVRGADRCADHDAKIFTHGFWINGFKRGTAQCTIVNVLIDVDVQIDGTFPVVDDESAVALVLQMLRLKKVGGENKLDPGSIKFSQQAVVPLGFP